MIPLTIIEHIGCVHKNIEIHQLGDLFVQPLHKIASTYSYDHVKAQCSCQQTYIIILDF